MRCLGFLTGVLVTTYTTGVAMGATPKAQAQDLDSQAIALLHAHHDGAAAAKIRIACRLDPYWGESWGLRAVLAFQQQRLAAAKKYLLKALARTPYDPADLNNMAVLAETQNHPLHACTYYLKALSAHPGGHQVYDNVCSQINAMVASRSLRFRTLRAAFIIADAELQKRMATKGLIRYGATWVSITKQHSTDKVTRRFLQFENTLLTRYRTDLKKLRDINTQGRVNQKHIAILVHLTNSDAWNNPVNAERQQLFAAQIQQNKLLAARAAVLLDLARVSRRIGNLLHSPVGRIFCAPPKMILPDPASSTETPWKDAPAALKNLDPSSINAYAIIIKADQQAITNLKSQIRSDRKLADKKDLIRQTQALQIAKIRLKTDTRNMRGPVVRFWGASDHAGKIVYIVDHEGCLQHCFGLLRRQLVVSINRLNPTQQFAVIVFCRHDRFVGPHRLVMATVRNKKRCLRLLRGVTPLASPGRQLTHFTRPFKAALHLHPQTIFFLTGSGCSAQLANYVHHLNKRVQAHIFTYTLMPRGDKAAATMQMIAQENAGQYRNFSPADSGD